VGQEGVVGLPEEGGLLGTGEVQLLGVVGVVEGYAQDLARGEGEEPGNGLGVVGLPGLVQEEAIAIDPLVHPALVEKAG
jgi:hypothetical protein